MGDSEKPLNNTPDMQDALRSIEAIREDERGTSAPEPQAPAEETSSSAPTPADGAARGGEEADPTSSNGSGSASGTEDIR